MKLDEFLVYAEARRKVLQEERKSREQAEDRYYAELGELLERHPPYNPTRVLGRSTYSPRGNESPIVSPS